MSSSEIATFNQKKKKENTDKYLNGVIRKMTDYADAVEEVKRIPKITFGKPAKIHKPKVVVPEVLKQYEDLEKASILNEELNKKASFTINQLIKQNQKQSLQSTLNQLLSVSQAEALLRGTYADNDPELRHLVLDQKNVRDARTMIQKINRLVAEGIDSPTIIQRLALPADEALSETSNITRRRPVRNIMDEPIENNEDFINFDEHRIPAPVARNIMDENEPVMPPVPAPPEDDIEDDLNEEQQALWDNLTRVIHIGQNEEREIPQIDEEHLENELNQGAQAPDEQEVVGVPASVESHDDDDERQASSALAPYDEHAKRMLERIFELQRENMVSSDLNDYGAIQPMGDGRIGQLGNLEFDLQSYYKTGNLPYRESAEAEWETIPKQRANLINLLLMTAPHDFKGIIQQTTAQDLNDYSNLILNSQVFENNRKFRDTPKFRAMVRRRGETNTTRGFKQNAFIGFGLEKNASANTLNSHGHLGDVHIDKMHMLRTNEVVVKDRFNNKEVLRTPLTDGLKHLLTSPNLSKQAKKSIQPHDIEIWQNIYHLGNVKPKSKQRRQLMNNPSITYKNPHSQLERLHVLCGSVDAGNKGKLIKQQIAMVLDDLLREKAITRFEHKKIYEAYVL